MTYDAFHSHGEKPSMADDAKSATEHLVHCVECRRLVDAHEELSRRLQLVRHSAPEVPASVDLAVLTAYRRHVEQQQAVPAALSLRKRENKPAIWFAWTAIAATLAAAAILFLVDRKPASPPNQRAAQSRPATTPEQVPPGKAPVEVAEQGAVRTKPRPRFAKREPASTLVTAFPMRSLPAGFQSLMYCDSLSCSDAMEIIRMQLPASMNRDPGWQTSGTVQADVLVGSDGIARAIRIVN